MADRNENLSTGMNRGLIKVSRLYKCMYTYFYIVVFLYFLLLLTFFMGSERAAKTRIENNFQSFLW